MRESNEDTKDTNDSLKNSTTSTKFGPITVNGYKSFYTPDSYLARSKYSEWRLLHHENEPICSSNEVACSPLLGCLCEDFMHLNGSRAFKTSVAYAPRFKKTILFGPGGGPAPYDRLWLLVKSGEHVLEISDDDPKQLWLGDAEAEVMDESCLATPPSIRSQQ